jgi:molecular chaperone DnaK
VVVTAARYAFRRKVATAGGDASVYGDWSVFEEAAREPAFAARRAEDAGDLYRAYYLFREAELFGEAARVVKGDDSPQGLLARAQACEAGGDLLGAARIYERCAHLDRAVPASRLRTSCAAGCASGCGSSPRPTSGRCGRSG